MPTYIGTDKIKGAYVGTDKVKSIYVGEDKVYSSSIIPEGYEQLKCLTGNGNRQYIKTGIIPTSTMNMSVEFSTPNTVGNIVHFIFGVHHPTESHYNGPMFGVGFSQNTFPRGYVALGDGDSIERGSTRVNFSLDANVKTIIDNIGTTINKDGIYLGDGVYGQQVNEMYLFTSNKGNAPYNPDTKMKSIYSWSAKDGNDVANYIPLLRIADSKPCMYDLVTHQPKFNQGSGEFGYEKMDGTIVQPI